MAPIRPGFMLKLIRETSLAAALLSGILAASALHAQTAAQPGDDEEVRWTLPPPSHLLTKPAPITTAPVAVEPARTETPNPFGGAPVMLQAAPATPEQPSILAPSATLPSTLHPPASPEAPAPVTAAVTPAFAPAPVPAPAPSPAATLAPPQPASQPVAAAKPDMAKPGAKKQAAKAQGEAKPVAKAKPDARIAAKPSPKSAEGKTPEGKAAKAKVAKPTSVAAQPVPAPRPEYVPPPPSMLEKEPEESRIPVISTVMDGMSSVTKTIGGLFE